MNPGELAPLKLLIRRPKWRNLANHGPNSNAIGTSGVAFNVAASTLTSKRLTVRGSESVQRHSTVMSLPVLASSCPSGLNATDQMPEV
jgi:hypothetical protein